MTAGRPGVPIRRTDGRSLWRQILEQLRQDIDSGTCPPGSRLPTEAELSARFGVNRHTVRRALEELTRTGLIRVEQGRGAFVSEDVLEYMVEARTRFTEWVRKHNKEPSGRVLQLVETTANATVAAGLGIAPDDPVILLERLGLADDRPVSLTSHFFSARRFPTLLAGLRVTPRITEALNSAGVLDYLRLSTRVTARLPQPREIDLLKMPRNRPVLVIENTNVDRDGTVVEFAIGCYPTPRVQIVFEP